MRLLGYLGIGGRAMKINSNYTRVQPATASSRPRCITREEPTWDTPNAAREREQLRKVEKAMDGVGWTALIVAGLLATLVIIVQIGKKFYGW